MRGLLAATVPIGIAVSLACSATTTPKACARIEHAVTNLNPDVGVAFHFGATPFDANGSPLPGNLIEFTSLNPAVVRIHQDSGRAVAMSEGRAVLEARCRGTNVVDAVDVLVRQPFCFVAAAPVPGGFVAVRGGSQSRCGETVTITAQPNPGYIFGAWLAPAPIAGLPAPVTWIIPPVAQPSDPGPDYRNLIPAGANRAMDSYTVIARFDLVTYNLQVLTGGTGSGRVVVEPAMSAYPTGTRVTLTATPSTGSVFAGWQGACAGQSSVCAITVAANTSTTAIFNSAVTYTLSLATNGSGTGTISADKTGSVFPSGTVVTLTASAATGSAFAGWSGACAGQASTCAVAMDANKSVTATFNVSAPSTFTLSVATNGTGSGSVIANPPGPVYAANTTVTLTAAAASGSVFAGWGGACGGTSPACTLVMSASRSVTATFNASSSQATYSGPFNTTFTLFRTTFSPAGCTWTVAITSTLTLTLRQSGTSVSGSMRALGRTVATKTQGNCIGQDSQLDATFTVSGTTSNITVDGTYYDGVSATFRVRFTGALANGVVAGQTTISYVGGDGNGTSTVNVTLR